MADAGGPLSPAATSGVFVTPKPERSRRPKEGSSGQSRGKEGVKKPRKRQKPSVDVSPVHVECESYVCCCARLRANVRLESGPSFSLHDRKSPPRTLALFPSLYSFLLHGMGPRTLTPSRYAPIPSTHGFSTMLISLD